PRTEREIWASLDREVGQERWTSLDQQLQARSKDHQVDLASKGNQPLPLDQRARLIGRLQRLEAMGLAREVEPCRWQLRADAESTLRSMGERGDIIRTMQRAFTGERRELAIGGIVEARPTSLRAADRNIAALSKDGVYLTEEHRAHLGAHGDPRIHSDEIVDAHVRRLEALRRAGIVEREAEGI